MKEKYLLFLKNIGSKDLQQRIKNIPMWWQVIQVFMIKYNKEKEPTIDT